MCKEHIKAIKEVLKSKTTLPILKEVAHTRGFIRATDLETFIEIKAPNIPDGVYKPEALELGFKVELIDKDYTTDDFPEVEPGKVKQELELSGDDLTKIIRASEFVSKDQTRPVLTGVALRNNMAFGSDGYRLYSNRLENEVSEPITLPVKLIKVLKALKAEKHDWNMSVYENDMVALVSGNITVYSKTIDGQQPAYEQILKDYTVSATIILDLATLKAPKDWIVEANREDLTVKVRDRNGDSEVEISKNITLEDGTYEPIGYERNIVMAMNSGNKNLIHIDPTLFKPYGKSKVKLWVRTSGQVEVEVIK